MRGRTGPVGQGIGGTGPAGPGGAWLAAGTTDTTNQSPTVDVATWNRANAAGLTYTIPADTIVVPHATTAYGFEYKVKPPAGKQLWDPIGGAYLAADAVLTTTSGLGATLVWSRVIDDANKIFCFQM